MTNRPMPPRGSNRPDPRRSHMGSRTIGTPPPRSALSSLLMWTVVGAAMLFAVAAGFLIGLAPTSLVRDEIVREVKAKTGRDLVVAGSTSLSLFPSLAVTLSDVAVSPPPGMVGEPTARIGRIDASIPFSALFTSRVDVTRLALHDPVIELRVDRDGRRSWEAKEDGSPRPAGTGAAAQSAPRAGNASGDVFRDIGIGDVRITNGIVRYLDERTGTRDEVRALDLTVTGGARNAPVEITGSADWRAERLEFSARLQPGLDGHTNATLALEGRRVSLGYQGRLALAGAPELDGTVTASAPSLRELMAWLGAGAPPSSDAGAFAFKGSVRTSGSTLTLSEADLTLGGTRATGSAVVDTGGVRPRVKADLQLSALDLGGDTGPQTPASAGSPQTGGTSAQQAQAGWSEETIDFGVLGLADIEAKLAIGRLGFGGLKLGQTTATVVLKDRVLKFGLDDTRLYEGRGRGVVSVDASGSNAAIGADLAFEGISILPMLTDTAEFDWLAGRTDLQVKLAGRGTSERAIAESLGGTASVKVVDGAIVGVNIPQIIRSVAKGRFSDLGQTGTEKTDFSEMTASFRVTDGVAETQDLRMLSPLMRMTAAGTIDVGRRQLDATLKPRLVGSLSGQGGAADLAGLEVPIRLSGPWSEPELNADIDSVLKDPDKAVETLKELGKQLDDSGLGDVLRKLFK